jgi:glycosyltransferase involved in cell wall biosynthesis
VIATAAGGAIELIEPEVTGKLVPPGDAQALACAIAELLAAPHTAARMTQQAYSSACDRFSLAVMLQNFDRVLQSVG